MVEETDLAWLASFIEAEGSITFQTTIRKNGNLVIEPFITVVNASKMAINEIVRICEELEIKVTTYWRRHKKCDNLDVCNIRINGCYHTKNLLDKIYPYLKTEKKENGRKMYEYIESRQNGLLKRNKLGQVIRNGYTKKEVELVCSVRKHLRAKSMEELLQCKNIVA